jgi:hypothetical protein
VAAGEPVRYIFYNECNVYRNSHDMKLPLTALPLSNNYTMIGRMFVKGTTFTLWLVTLQRSLTPDTIYRLA